MNIAKTTSTALLMLGLAVLAPAAIAQQTETTPAEGTETPAVASSETASADAAAPEASEEDQWLKVYFDLGSARVRADQGDTLDVAARTFREGDPYVMIVTGVADTVGSPSNNLALSLQRAESVVNALAARGIPVDRLQVLGRGNSELIVNTGDDVPEEENRVVEISWR